MTHTSIGPDPRRGGNENHDNDPRSKTLGENAPAREPPAGAAEIDQDIERPGAGTGAEPDESRGSGESPRGR